jgi:hypothetical protein
VGYREEEQGGKKTYNKALTIDHSFRGWVGNWKEWTGCHAEGHIDRHGRI